MLATMAGTSRPTVNRVLGEAAAEGLVRLTRGRVTVLDVSGLRHEAASG
jgi:CRP/FNR family transcriptional regulator, cyclic AMP receptor protein